MVGLLGQSRKAANYKTEERLAMKRKKQKAKVSTVIASKKDDKKTGKKKKKKIKIRGKEVSVRDSALQMQVIYGQMRIGGVITYIRTNADSAAYLVTGSEAEEDQIVWTSRSAGAVGNNISVRLILTGSHIGFTVTVVGSAIEVRLPSASGVSTGTAVQLVTAIRDDAAASALVTIERLDKNKNGNPEAFALANMSYGGGRILYQMVTIAGHKCEAIDALYLDERQVTFGATPDPRWGTGIWANKVFMAFQNGDDEQGAQSDLAGQTPHAWTDAHRQRGCAGAYIQLVWSQNLFSEGYPEIAFLVRGKLCYDPRTATNVYTQNAALIVADYLINTRWGEGIPYAKIDETALIAAADICDQAVSLAAGGTEPRYRINGVFDAGEDVLEDLLAAMDGDLVEQNGKLYIYAGAYRSPSLTIYETDVRAGIALSTHIQKADSFNAVRGTYISPTDEYNETDIPPVINSTYATQDGGTVWRDVSLNFVTSPSQAQRLLKIRLERVRQGQVLVLPLKLGWMNLQCCDTVQVTLARYGFSNKIFEVRNLTFEYENNGVFGPVAILRETASGIYDWNNGEETQIDLADDTDLPDPFYVAPVTSVTLTSGTSELYTRQDGTIHTRLLVSWTASVTEFVEFGGFHELRFKRSALSDYSAVSIVPGNVTSYHITDVEDSVQYDVQVRAVNTLGYFSEWAGSANHTVIGKTERPTDPAALTAQLNTLGVIFGWEAIPDLDADVYQLRYTQTDQSWEASTVIVTTKAVSYTWRFQVAGTYKVYLKSYDTSRNESTGSASTTFTIAAPTAPVLSFQLSGPSYILTWTRSIAQWEVREYEIQYTPDSGPTVTLAVITGLSYRALVDWGGARRFTVLPRDIANNTGAPGILETSVAIPGAVIGFDVTQFGSNLLMDWQEPSAGDLPISRYYVRRGTVYATADLIGTVSGTFAVWSERIGGSYTYWITPEDSAGNLGPQTSRTVTVPDPDDFVIQSDVSLVPYWTSSEKAIKGGTIWAPDADSNSFYAPIDSTIEETASLPLMILQTPETLSMLDDAPPTTTDAGFLEFTIDYEATLESIYIDFSYSEEVIGGTVDIVPQISLSLDGSTYTDYPATSEMVGSNFRYAKYRLDFDATTTAGLSRIYDIRARLSLEIDEEYQIVDVFAADSGGTLVTFGLPFIDLQDLQVTAIGSAELKAVANFVDAPNPTDFKILLFDAGGTRVDGTVSYRAKGTVEPS